ncbi:MAG TPA: hypothetical protein VGJ41_13125 [Nocardioides sp.]
MTSASATALADAVSCSIWEEDADSLRRRIAANDPVSVRLSASKARVSATASSACAATDELTAGSRCAIAGTTAAW